MELSISPAARAKLKDFLICFSLGNLCFLRRWYDLEHLKERSMDYYRVHPADPTLLMATLISALLLSVAIWLAWLWVQRDPTPRKLQLARCGFLLLLVFPLESVRRYWNSEGGRTDWGTNGAVLALEILLAAGLVFTLLGNRRVVLAARRVVLMLTFLFPSLMVDFAWSRASEEPASAYLPKPNLPMLESRSGQHGRRRVIWMLFDEFDQRLAFELRQPRVDLPELDRLRGESLVAQHAHQTAPWTTLALPSLLSGRVYSRADLVDANTLRVYPEGEGGTNWRDQPNVFKKARELGANSEIIGWHHPYCRVFGDATVRCMDVPSGHPTVALLRETSVADEGVPEAVRFLFALQLGNMRDMLTWGSEAVSENGRDVYVQRRQLQQYSQIRDRAYCEAADPNIDLLFIHFPLPHPFAIYDRERQDFSLSSHTSYVDNLALVDRTVGEMRKTLESAGLWDSTSLLITSDHGLRPDLWRGRMGWTEELERLTGGGQSQTVPFILKLGGENHGVVYDRGFSGVVSSELALAALRGDVTTPQSAAAWLNAHSSTN
jgi:hypothetical protein